METNLTFPDLPDELYRTRSKKKKCRKSYKKTKKKAEWTNKTQTNLREFSTPSKSNNDALTFKEIYNDDRLKKP